MQTLLAYHKFVYKCKTFFASFFFKLNLLICALYSLYLFSGKQGLAGAAERMRNLVSQELDVVVSVKEAKQSREQLIKDRTVMGKELAELKRKQRVTMTNTEREQMSKRISELEDEMTLRNTQISDLQNQLMGKS